MAKKIWVAAYLFYGGSLDEFLKNAILPCVKRLKEKNSFEPFFFIRYPERGKHIRLRFKTDKKSGEDVVKPFLIKYFNEYFEKYPSERNEPEWVKNLPDDKKWLPNNSIHFFEYEPEIERYGGPVGMEISEEHFQICSETVLNALAHSEEWGYSKAMGIAIQLMVSFCITVGMSIKEMIDFFSFYCDMYIPAGIRSYYLSERIDNIESYKPKLLEVYAEKYNSRKDFYIKFHNELLKLLEEREAFEEEWFNDWILGNKKISEKLNRTFLKNELVFPESFINNYIREKNDSYKLFYIYFSYMHMTYNRLGLENKDESFLCYIIKESLKTL
jgi:hypothetical protein